jgi:hypothetical protein
MDSVPQDTWVHRQRSPCHHRIVGGNAIDPQGGEALDILRLIDGPSVDPHTRVADLLDHFGAPRPF